MIVQNSSFSVRIPFKTESILSLWCDCPESMLVFKNSIENEAILSRRYDCPESMLFFNNSIENKVVLSRKESMLFLQDSTEYESILGQSYDCRTTVLTWTVMQKRTGPPYRWSSAVKYVEQCDTRPAFVHISTLHDWTHLAKQTLDNHGYSESMLFLKNSIGN